MDYKERIDALEKMIDLVQSNVNHNLELSWAILGVVVAIIGVALYFLAKMWVGKRVDTQIESLKSQFKEMIKQNPQFYYAKGVFIPIIKRIDEHGKYSSVIFAPSKQVMLDLPTIVDIYYEYERKLKHVINEYNIIQNHSTIELEVMIPEEIINTNYYINWSVIWENPFFGREEYNG